LSFHFEGARQLGALGISSEIIGMLNYGTLSGIPAVTHHWAAIIATNVASVVGLEEFQGIFFAQPSQNLLAENCLPSITDSLDILPNFQDDPLVFISFPATCSRLDVVENCINALKSKNINTFNFKAFSEDLSSSKKKSKIFILILDDALHSELEIQFEVRLAFKLWTKNAAALICLRNISDNWKNDWMWHIVEALPLSIPLDDESIPFVVTSAIELIQDKFEHRERNDKCDENVGSVRMLECEILFEMLNSQRFAANVMELGELMDTILGVKNKEDLFGIEHANVVFNELRQHIKIGTKRKNIHNYFTLQ